MDREMVEEPAVIDDNERRLAQAILLQALQDLKSTDDEVAKEAIDWLLDEPNDFREAILSEATNLHQDDIREHVRKAFRED